MAVLQAYFDESFEDDGFLCVAGYVFKKTNLNKFDASWRSLLGRYGLPYFRMSACAHGNRPFDKLSKPDRVTIAKEAIGLIKRYCSLGICAGINQHTYTPKFDIAKTPYEYCVWMCIEGVSNWANNNFPVGKLAYFFESGHKHRSQADQMMHKIFEDARLREISRYGGHAFVIKEESRPSQAADLLAWQSLTEYKHQRDSKPRRKDYASLIEGDDHVVLVDEPIVIRRKR